MDINKLSEDKKQELRKFIIEELKGIKEGSKITLPYNIIEPLIFDKNKPIWTGEFLSKLDLSFIEYNNVGLNLKENAEKNLASIDFSNTNIKVKMFYSLDDDFQLCSIINTNFDNVDLSKTNTSEVIMIKNSTFNNSGLKLKNLYFKMPYYNDISDYGKQLNVGLKLSNSSFINCNLSELTVRLEVFSSSEVAELNQINFTNCNFNGSKLHILDEGFVNEDHFNELIQKGYLDECYLDNLLINHEECDTLEKLRNKKQELEVEEIKKLIHSNVHKA